MTPKKSTPRASALEHHFASEEPEIWRVYIQGALYGKPKAVRKQIMQAIVGPARALPGVQTVRVTAKQARKVRARSAKE